MSTKTKIVFFYDWFYPGFKAGGPIQSLINLAITLSAQCDIYVITGAYDLKSREPYPGILVNKWNDVELPGSRNSLKVFYGEKCKLTIDVYKRLLAEATADVIYFNGLFSYRFLLLPLFALKELKQQARVTVAPRGMLKKAALSQKWFKKRIYLAYLKMTGLLNQCYWHATSPEEATDISQCFPSNKGIIVAPNIPKKPWSAISTIKKQKGNLKLVYLALINEHKNLLLLLNAVDKIRADITLHVYGPVVDKDYWMKCVEMMGQMPEKVEYKGAIEPAIVQQILSNYHALILFTKGENFSHSVYEAFSVARPVITSEFTPWIGLEQRKAGMNADINDMNDCVNKVVEFAGMDQSTYNMFCCGAHAVANEYYKNLEAVEKYTNLFLGR